MYPEPTTNNTSKYVVGIVIIALVIIGVSLMGRDKKLSGTEKSTTDKEVAGQTSTIPTIDSPDTKETAVTPAQNVTEVVYTDANGFTPNNLSVKVGDTVKFLNKSTGKMWVGSNEHPTHMEYDGTSLRDHCAAGATLAFDQCASGTEYSFTFTKAGTFNYHNHARATMRGTVTVK